MNTIYLMRNAQRPSKAQLKALLQMYEFFKNDFNISSDHFTDLMENKGNIFSVEEILKLRQRGFADANAMIAYIDESNGADIAFEVGSSILACKHTYFIYPEYLENPPMYLNNFDPKFIFQWKENEPITEVLAKITFLEFGLQGYVKEETINTLGHLLGTSKHIKRMRDLYVLPTDKWKDLGLSGDEIAEIKMTFKTKGFTL